MHEYNVRIFADCEAIINGEKPDKTIQMYADDPSIVDSNQGGYELSIKVPHDSVITWQVFPKTVQPKGPDGATYWVLIDAEHDFDGDKTKKGLLHDWTAHQGAQTVWVYEPDGIHMHQNEPLTPVSRGAFQPYVKATAALNIERPGPQDSDRDAYTFWINVYRNGTLAKKDYFWDPFIKVYGGNS